MRAAAAPHTTPFKVEKQSAFAADRFDHLPPLRPVTQRDVDRAEGRLDPLLVALYGGPGTGKSTTAALVFGTLKQRGYNVELVHEVAKDLTWEGRSLALGHQPYVAAQQMFAYDKLDGQVDAIITDTSTLLSLVYGKMGRAPLASLAFQNWIVADWRARWTLNVFLRRSNERPYNPKGRSQSEQAAREADFKIRDVLNAHQFDYWEIDMTTNQDHVEEIVAEVQGLLG